MLVTVQYDSKVLTFNDVTHIENFLAFDMFENYIVIHQGRKKTKIKEHEIFGYEVKAGGRNETN